MIRLIHLFANGLWYLSSLPESLVYHLARRDVATVQQNLLIYLLHRNAKTQFGRQYGFASIRSVAEYQARVPLSTYDDYQEAIQQIGLGWPRILTKEPVLLLEPTSGSTAATKHIPYTATLKAEFQRAVAPWVVNLFSRHPSLALGQAYWSITPVTRRNERTPGGIPIGFAEDSEYFGNLQRRLIQIVLAVPPLVRLIEDMEAFRYVTLLFLLRSRSLVLISIWNPTFLILLIRRLADWWPHLVSDIMHGTLSPPAPLAADLAWQLGRLNRPDRHRAREVEAAFQTHPTPGAIHAQLWPQLQIISCWTEAQAALYVPELAQLFPQARLQSKGLMATEGFISLPLIDQEGAALAIRSHFFEFLPMDNDQTAAPAHPSHPRLAHEIEIGGYYAVVITTGGGLYRYQLQDLVQVVGFLGDCPLLRFIGKESYISDWFGEKLNERHVRLTLDKLFKHYAIQPTFAMVACDEQAGRHAYTLFIETKQTSPEILRDLGHELEAALQENYHYRYCRDLGQLDTAGVFHIEGRALEIYLKVCQTHGQRAGDIKPVVLHRRNGWSRAFPGHLIST